MKRILKITAFAILLLLGSSLRNSISAQYNDYGNDGYYDDGYGSDREVSYQTFYDELSPHGRWVEYPGQGYVWVPDAGPDFRPYSTNGHWVYSDDYEWMWVSDYDWGWAPFHYGRWDYDSYYGWYWVPGYEWSPAWVAWRDGGDYYGWAPLRPGINISVNFNIGMYSPPVNFWVFSPRRYITSPRLYDYCVDPRRNVTIINITNIITNNYRYSNNYGFRTGPRRYDAERYIGRINPVRLRNSNTPGRSVFRSNEVSIYRPRVRQDNNNRTIAPRRFDRYESNTANRGNNENGNVFRRNNDDRQVNNNDRRFERQGTVDNNNGNNNRRFERKNEDVIRERQQQQSNPADNRRFERNDNSNGNDNRRFERRNDDAVRQQQQQQQMEQRRRNDDAVRQQQQQQQMEQRRRNDDAVRQQQQQQQMEQRRQQQQADQQRRFERRNDDAVRQQQQQQQMEQRRVQQSQNDQRRFERNNNASRPEPQPQQNRGFERRDNGNGGGNGNGARNSKKRFE